jgi:Ca2+-binding EF-hand superfamily protein
MPGQPNLDAFESQEMEPFIFQEQLKRAFYMKLTPPELGALMDFFDADENGYIKCHNFIIKFSRLGLEERQLKSERFRKHDLEVKEKRKLSELNKLKNADEKNHIKTVEFNEEQFNTAMTKLTDAAIKYNSNGPGSAGLAAFEATHMQPHIFREQLKLAFGVIFTNNELSALMSYFDKANHGRIVCKDFIIQFFRTGFEERNRIKLGFREEDLRKKVKDKKLEEEKEKIQSLKAAKDVDYDFTESDFDGALNKLILTCCHFDRRQLGPAGFGAFTSESLTPSEFREMAKRTFNMKLTTYELGALVTYFDLHMKGVVHCTTFLNSFVQIRVQLEVYKGKPGEAEHIEAYHSQLKEGYKQRIMRNMLSGHDNLKPWKGYVTFILINLFIYYI